MKLTDFIEKLSPVLSDFSIFSNPEITGVTNQSAEVKPGMLFCAVKGSKFDGHDFLSDAIRNGAAGFVIHESYSGNTPQNSFRVSDSYFAWAILCAEMAGNPGDHLRVHGITGTNGKTTTAMLLHYFLTVATKRKTGLLTTVFTDVCNGIRNDSANTMPDAQALQNFFSQMLHNGAQDAVMECSSHGLSQTRSGRLRFYSAIFTNLTGDHLDYHGSMENYYLAKKRLFTVSAAAGMPAIINIDDSAGKRLYNELFSESVNPVSVSLRDPSADYYASDLSLNEGKSSFIIHSCDGVFPVQTRLTGQHNVYNFLCAFAAAAETGTPPADIAAAAPDAPAAPGRLEAFSLPSGAHVFVDYAHTDDALLHVTQTLNAVRKKDCRLITVFGCGGNRDRTKRPRMGKAAAENSDIVIVTSDNPRMEDPMSIILEILPGIPAGKPYIVEPDRRKAISLALSQAENGDQILIAGKGHESYQEICGIRYHFDDREEVQRFSGNNN